MNDPAGFHSLVALHVTDDDGYRRYRAGMTPLLAGYGGRFLHDFVVAEALQSAADHPVNRVFVLVFPDRAAKEAFFADPAYRAVRAEHFAGAVAGATIIAEYEQQEPPAPRG
jgi:uncharacterized protein (DUF1330 family)